MVMRNIVTYRKQAYTKKGLFVYYGTGALKKGYGMCFDMAYVTTTVKETATDPFGARGLKIIAKPTGANSLAFAGVVTQDYPARTSGLQLVELYLPGGCAKLAFGGLSTVLDTTMLTCQIGPDTGRFTLGGFKGKGSALALQTKTITDITNLAFASLDGTAIESTGGSTYTITKTGIGTACGYGADPADLATQYTCVILGGGDDDEVVTPKVVNVLTAPTADTITVSAASGTTPYISLYVYKGNPTILAYLYDGEESGLVEFVSPDDNAAAQHLLVSGVTFVCGGYTMTTGVSTSVLADGIIEGQRKAFAGLGALSGNGYDIEVTSGKQQKVLDEVTTGQSVQGGPLALAGIIIDAAAEFATLDWTGNFGSGTTGVWSEKTSVGATLAAS